MIIGLIIVAVGYAMMSGCLTYMYYTIKKNRGYTELDDKNI